MELEQLSDIKKALAQISKQRSALADYYRYYDGDHRLNFASKKFRNKFGSRLQNLADNLCKPVVNAPVSRLEVINFSEESGDATDKAWQVWKRNKMPLHAKTVHREAFRAGYSYVIVWQDLETKKARIDPQRTSNVALWRSEETGESKMAAKFWTENELHYLTLYYPDRIEKYITKDKSKTFPTRGEDFIERENFKVENPFGVVPVIEFSATEKVSFIHDVIKINDVVNKSLCDLMVGAEYNSIRQRYTAGIQYEKDEETGKPIIPYAHDDQVWTSESDTAKFGEFSDAKLDQFLKTIEWATQEIARLTGLPAHYFAVTSGDFPSGEALRTAEARFISLLEESQLSFGESWAAVMNLALRIENDTPDSPIEVQWRDASPVSIAEKLSNGILKQQIGVSTEIVLSEIGYTEQQIKDSLKAKTEAQKTAAESFGKIFDGGLNQLPS